MRIEPMTAGPRCSPSGWRCGAEPLQLTNEHITAEGANTSFQVHVRVAPGEFTRVFNAARRAGFGTGLLGVIGARVASGQTGAAWQRAALAAAECGQERNRALAVMLDRYLSRAATGQPVHT
jgi:hypothetical protein